MRHKDWSIGAIFQDSLLADRVEIIGIHTHIHNLALAMITPVAVAMKMDPAVKSPFPARKGEMA